MRRAAVPEFGPQASGRWTSATTRKAYVFPRLPLRLVLHDTVPVPVDAPQFVQPFVYVLLLACDVRLPLRNTTTLTSASG